MKISKINDLDLLVSEIETVSIRDQIEVHLNQFELKSYIKVFRGREILRLQITDISYFASDNKVVYAYHFGQKYRTELTLNNLETDYKLLLRINKQTVVNITKIDHLKPDINGRCRITMQDDYCTFISRAYQKDCLKRIGEYYA